MHAWHLRISSSVRLRQIRTVQSSTDGDVQLSATTWADQVESETIDLITGLGWTWIAPGSILAFHLLPSTRMEKAAAILHLNHRNISWYRVPCMEILLVFNTDWPEV